MKFNLVNTVALALTLSSVNAAITPIRLAAKSSDPTIDGAGVSSIHEGAAINYLTLGQGSPGSELTLNTTGQYITYQLQPDINLVLNQVGGIVQFYPSLGFDKFDIDASGALTLNGSSDGFWTCQNINDPYRYQGVNFVLYSADKPAVGDNCSPVVLVNVENGAANSTSSVSTSTATPLVANTTVSTTLATTVGVSTLVTVTNCPERTESSSASGVAVETETPSTSIAQTNGAGFLTASSFVLLASISSLFVFNL